MHNEVLLRPVEDSWCESCTGNITEEETWCNAAVQTNKGTQIASNCQVNQVNLPKASVALAFAACALHIQLFRSKPWGNKRMNWSGHNIHDTICLPIFCILLILQFLRLSHICTLPKTWIIGNLLWHNQTLWQDWIVCTGFAILMLSSERFKQVKERLIFAWVQRASLCLTKPVLKQSAYQGTVHARCEQTSVNCPTFFWMQCCLGPEGPRWWVPQEGTPLCLSSTWQNLGIQWNFCESGIHNPNHCLEI